MNCAIHNKPMRQNSRGWYCATKLQDGSWCNWKPEQGQPAQTGQRWSGQRAPEKSRMTKEEWELKDKRRDNNILLQTAFKAAVELYCAGKLEQQGVTEATLFYHKWLLSHTEGQTPHSGQNLAPKPTLGFSSQPEDYQPEEPPLEAYVE